MSTFYIASLKHTHAYHGHIQWWGRFHRGYTPVLGPNIGAYCYGEACALNDGQDTIAVPVKAVLKLLSPEPYFKPGARFYDQRGPVVDNTRANWNALLAARLVPDQPDRVKPKPEPFRGKRRCIAGAQVEAA